MKAVDLFAGLGGFSLGAEQAGCEVVWAANHWQSAVEFHSANHPSVQHSCQDLQQANWYEVPSHDLLLASPSCTGHTPARGREMPRHDAARATAWAVVSCLEVHRPSFAIVENVPKFCSWVLYPAWKLAVESLGYSVSAHLLDAADFGVPQNRVRVFIVLAKGKAPLVLRASQASAHVGVRGCIEWERFAWTAVDGHAPATIARIARGRAEVGSQFACPYYGSGSGETGRSLDRPLGTVTTRDRWALVDGERMRMFGASEYRRIMGFPEDYKLPSNRSLAIHLLGNAVCPAVPKALIPLLN